MKTPALSLLVVLALLATSTAVFGQAPSGSELLDRSIRYHDPGGVWSTYHLQLDFEETRPDGSARQTNIAWDGRTGLFEIDTSRDGKRIEGSLTAQGCETKLDGSTEISDEEREKYRLSCDRLAWMRNYYTYLWGVPMKLEDPGTKIGETVEETEFDGKKVLGLRVTYDESVGKDIWYFYFDPQSAALVGYRFYHDEAANDGEYIHLEGEAGAAGLRLPKTRTWYTHKENELLGTDTLVRLVATP